MNLDEIFEDARRISLEFGLTASFRLYIDSEFFIQIYINLAKNKINMALVLRNERCYGFDAEGGRYHLHPTEDPNKHIFIEEKISLRDFVMKSLKFAEDKGLI